MGFCEHSIQNALSFITRLKSCVFNAFSDKASISKDLQKEAATLLYEINTKHPFWGGNKRTAFEASKIFLLSNGIKLKTEYDDVVIFVNDMAQGKITYQKNT